MQSTIEVDRHLSNCWAVPCLSETVQHGPLRCERMDVRNDVGCGARHHSANWCYGGDGFGSSTAGGWLPGRRRQLDMRVGSSAPYKMNPEERWTEGFRWTATAQRDAAINHVGGSSVAARAWISEERMAWIFMNQSLLNKQRPTVRRGRSMQHNLGHRRRHSMSSERKGGGRVAWSYTAT